MPLTSTRFTCTRAPLRKDKHPSPTHPCSHTCVHTHATTAHSYTHTHPCTCTQAPNIHACALTPAPDTRLCTHLHAPKHTCTLTPAPDTCRRTPSLCALRPRGAEGGGGTQSPAGGAVSSARSPAPGAEMREPPVCPCTHRPLSRMAPAARSPDALCSRSPGCLREPHLPLSGRAHA